MWDERDHHHPPKRPTRQTGHDLPAQPGHSTGDMGRITGTVPVVREDGVLFLPPGTLFQEKYQVIEVLGEGTTSVVHKARHSVMKNTVVIKLMKGVYASNSRAVLRFQREGQAVSRLNHQNLVRTFDFGLSREGQPYLAIEWFDGKSLQALIREHGAPPLPMALHFFQQLVDGLNSAHAAGFVHRGLKPSNVFVINLGTQSPLIKIVDFGVADVFDEEEDGSKRAPKGGPFFGAPQYMSPEQCQGKNLDDRTDIYSLGCVMYEVLTGVPAVAPGSNAEMMQRQVQDTPRSFRVVAPTRTELSLIEPIVMKCLAKDPGSRYQTMAQLSRALKELDEAAKNDTASSVVIDNSAALAAEEEERRRTLLLQRILIAVAAVLLLIPIVGVVLFKMSEVEVALAGPPEHAAFSLNRGQYDDAKKQIAALLSDARKANRKADVVRLLGDQAVLEHILGDKDGEGRDDKEITDINQAGGSQIFVEPATGEAIDALLASDKSTEELETALKDPVQKMVDITQGLAWSQQYAPAQEAMALLIDKLSRKLGPNSKLVVELKLQYASRLLQKIINPATPLSLHEQQDLVGEPMSSLDTPMSQGEGSDLLVAKSNFALAQAISSKTEDAIKLRDEVAGDYKNQKEGPDNTSLIEVRLGDTDMALGDAKAALPLFKSAYQKFLSEKKYAQAAYCVSAYSRSFWLAGQVKDGYDFLNSELAKPESGVPEAAILKAELQAWLAQLDYWTATADDGILKQFFPGRNDIKKSSSDLRRDAERLAMESLISTESTRPSEFWLSNPALETLADVYSEGNTVGRSIPLVRLKLALAQRTNNVRAVDSARSNLGAALIACGKAPFSSFYTNYDHSQISLDKADPAQEARSLYEQNYNDITTGGDTSIFWLDKWFANLASKYVDNDAVKVVLLTACRKSCDNVAATYGKTSDEYLSQLRSYGALGESLGRTAEAKAGLIEAKDIALANAGLPLLDRVYVYNDLVHLCQSTNDSASAKKYIAEMGGLKN